MRRSFFAIPVVAALLGGLALTAACARPGSPEPVELPAGEERLVAASSFVGGFLPVEWTYFAVAKIAVYSDGLAVADGERQLTLSDAEVRTLVGNLRRELRGLGANVEPIGSNVQVADASSTKLQVLGADGNVQSVQAYALDLLPGYPKSLHSADRRLADLAERVKRDGQPYTADRIRLVAMRSEPTDASPWPASVPVPPVNGQGVRVADLAGAQALAVRTGVPMRGPNGQWPVLRTPDGDLLGVVWRYLLPDE